MSDLLSEISKIIQSFHQLHAFRHIYLFEYYEEKTFIPLLHKGSVKGKLSSLNLKKKPSFADICLMKKADAEDGEVGKIFEYYDLQLLHALSRSETKIFLLGISQKSGSLLNTDMQFIRVLADTLSARIQNINLNKELLYYADRTRQMISELSILHEINRAIDSAQHIDSLLNYITEKSMNLIGAESASLMLIVKETNELEFKIALGPKSSGVKPFRLPLGSGIAGWVAEHNEPILIPDAYADPRFDPSFDKRSGYRTRSYLCVPMTHKNKTIGVMTVLNRHDHKPFNDNDQILLSTFATQAALAIENAKLLHAAMEKERIESELQVASEIQRLLIPKILPKIPGVDIASTYLPCKEIGGDYYDVFPIDENRFVFVVADVAGKSVSGALLVSNMQASLKAHLEYNDDLLLVTDLLNKDIIKNTTIDRYITFFIAVYNTKDLSFTSVNAGHNPPFLLTNQNGITELKTGGIFLGYTPWQYESEKNILETDFVILMFTDGLIEAMNHREEEFSEKRLQAILQNFRKYKADEIKNEIIRQINEFVGGKNLEDDFTLVVLKKN